MTHPIFQTQILSQTEPTPPLQSHLVEIFAVGLTKVHYCPLGTPRTVTSL